MVRFRYPFARLIGRLILLAYLTPTSLLFIPLSIVMVASCTWATRLYGLMLVYLTFSLPLWTWLLRATSAAMPPSSRSRAWSTADRIGALVRVAPAAVGAGPGGDSDLHLHRRLERAAAGARVHHLAGTRTAPLALKYLITSDVLLWGPLMAGAVLSSLPVMILYFLAQRFIVQGLTAGSVKG